MKTATLRLITLLGCVLLVAAAGCKREYTGTSSIFAGNGDRSVNITAEGPAFASAQSDRLIVSLEGHEVVIEKDRLLVDKTERAKVPAATKKFDVTLVGDTLTVTGDGAELLKAPINK